MLLSCLLLGWAFAVPTFDLALLEPGDQGYALTAGSGNEIERFPVEVLALQNDVGLGFPLILVKASGPFIEATGGVAAGMSGSPVYLPYQGEDQLLGAIGYVFPNSDHSLALVTPIEAMLDDTEAPKANPFGEAALEGLGPAMPVSTPILMSGLTARASQPLEPLFAHSRMTPLPVQLGGPVSAEQEAGYELQAGSAVSVQLVRGDVSISAVGTVTMLDDAGGVLAFGHPLLGQGAVSFGLAPAFISYIVPSDVVPFKLANSGEGLLGVIDQDRPAAISGRLDTEPDMLPVTLTLVGEEGSVTKSFEITNDERYYAPLLASATVQAFDEVLDRITEGTADLAWDLTLSDNSRVRVLEQITSPGDIASATARLSAEPLNILANNIYQEAELREVDINVQYSSRQRFADIIEVALETEEIEPGGVVTAYLRLQPYRENATLKTLRIPVPEDATGDLDITFRGGLASSESDEDDEDDDPILSFGELLAAFKENIQSSELIVETYVDGERVRLERMSFPYLVDGSETVTVSILGDDAEDEEDVLDDSVPPDGVPDTEPPIDEDNPYEELDEP